MKRNYLCLIFILYCFVIRAQDNTNLKEINKQIWNNFTKAFETLDFELFGSLHSEDFIRIGGDSKNIRDKENYLSGYKQRWQNKSLNKTISFRFLERICNDSIASERGIYKLTRNPNSDIEKSYFGKFHVILKMESSSWKIMVDYDSSENNTINETSYNDAYVMYDFNKFK
ncbi:nuclear transport factor 2 family protein [Yeosuana sp. MJ-SS3]|uniref:Nuclear transport factor 2 family protein n=1 Tax=Gilvirhabdus luticola TaxID=3079858 RepID=A0ABU3UA66_9FLAO|nr:nuclear transport factor 2 family protein [Yeosuana sp. MJ-SS3]MDU8887298.1 nuclear transport factor 2 family protein [Yeosuana sp. MJ-SS3]